MLTFKEVGAESCSEPSRRWRNYYQNANVWAAISSGVETLGQTRSCKLTQSVLRDAESPTRLGKS